MTMEQSNGPTKPGLHYNKEPTQTTSRHCHAAFLGRPQCISPLDLSRDGENLVNIPLQVAFERLADRPHAANPIFCSSTFLWRHYRAPHLRLNPIRWHHSPFHILCVHYVRCTCLHTGTISAAISLSGPLMGPFYASQRGGKMAIAMIPEHQCCLVELRTSEGS